MPYRRPLTLPTNHMFGRLPGMNKEKTCGGQMENKTTIWEYHSDELSWCSYVEYMSTNNRRKYLH